MRNPQHPLSDVLYSLALEDEAPTVALIDEYRKRFPEYADAITEFAMRLVHEGLRPDEPDVDIDELNGPPNGVVMRSISHFQNVLFKAANERRDDDAEAPSTPEGAAPIANPFRELSPTQFRQVAKELDVTSLFLGKLRDRLIIADTIPASFTQSVAGELGTPCEMLRAFLAAKPVGSSTVLFYKAVDKPTLQPPETFEQAVRTSMLSPGQQARLLKY